MTAPTTLELAGRALAEESARFAVTVSGRDKVPSAEAGLRHARHRLEYLERLLRFRVETRLG